jgi:ankyrin repeat protein
MMDWRTKKLFRAFENNKPKIARLMIFLGANINYKNPNDGKTHLINSIIKNKFDVAKQLLENGADPNIIDDTKGTALYYALLHYDKLLSSDIIQLLIKKGANIDYEDSEQKKIPLFIAIIAKTDNSIVKMLLESGAKVNINYNDGNTPLIVAIENENIEVVKMLLDKGANVNQKDINEQYGYTPLTVAIQKKYFKVVELLLDKGADVNQTNDDGFTPLTVAIFNDFYNVDIVKLLLDKGANVNEANIYGFTPLIIAIDEKYDTNVQNVEIVELLLKRGANVDQENKHGETPLYKAVSNNNEKIVEMLLERGADVNIANKHGETPLNRAVLNINVEIVELLLSVQGIDVNKVSKKGETPIKIALSKENYKIIEMLLIKSVNITDKDKEPLEQLLQKFIEQKKEYILKLDDTFHRNENNLLKGTIKNLLEKNEKPKNSIKSSIPKTLPLLTSRSTRKISTISQNQLPPLPLNILGEIFRYLYDHINVVEKQDGEGKKIYVISYNDNGKLKYKQLNSSRSIQGGTRKKRKIFPRKTTTKKPRGKNRKTKKHNPPRRKT